MAMTIQIKYLKTYITSKLNRTKVKKRTKTEHKVKRATRPSLHTESKVPVQQTLKEQF